MCARRDVELTPTHEAAQERRQHFTKIYDEQIRILTSAKVSGAEFAAYLALSQIHAGAAKGKRRDAEHPSWCFVSSKAAEEKYGLTRQKLRAALVGLTKKGFVTEDGRRCPILVQVKRGCSGTCATYADNAYAAAMGYPLTYPKGENGKGFQFPLSGENGKGFRAEWERFSPRMGMENTPPEEEQRKIQKIEPYGGALLAPQAKQSAAQVVHQASNSTSQVRRPIGSEMETGRHEPQAAEMREYGTRALGKPKLAPRGVDPSMYHSLTFEEWYQLHKEFKQLRRGEPNDWDDETWKKHWAGNDKFKPKATICPRCGRPASLYCDECGNALVTECEECGVLYLNEAEEHPA